MTAADSRKPRIRAIWFVAKGERVPRLGYSLRGTRVWAMIKELDPVVLTESLPEQGLQAGDVGWVVMVHTASAGYEVEFVTLAGETVAVVTVRAQAVRPVGRNEIAHARMVA